MNILTTNRIYRVLAVLALVVGLQFLPAVAGATVNIPVVIEPYDEESLRKIDESLISIRTYFDKLLADKKEYKIATKNYANSPTPENNATLTEKTGNVLKTEIEFLSKSEAAFGRAIPEIKKYREHLRKMIKGMEKQDGNIFLSERAEWARKEMKRTEAFEEELENMRDDFKKVKQDAAAFTTAWVDTKQIEKELKVVFSGRKIGAIRNEMAGAIDDMYEIRKMVMEQMRESGLSNSTDDLENGKEAYRAAINRYFDN